MATGAAHSAGAFDAWGSALISSLVGAVAVVIGVVFAQRLSDRRRRSEEELKAALQLVEQISNLRDEACSRDRGLSGNYDLYLLRNTLLLTFSTLGGFAAYDEVKRLYVVFDEWRDWVRRRQPRGLRVSWSKSEEQTLRKYQAAISLRADGVISLLQNSLRSQTSHLVAPTLPELPNLMERD